MSTKRTISGTTIAWLTSYRGPKDIVGDDQRALENLSFSTHDGMGEGENPWTRVGVATITVDLIDEQAMVENKVESLRKEKTATIAAAQMRATQIEQQIQSLLAIGFTTEMVTEDDDLPF